MRELILHRLRRDTAGGGFEVEVRSTSDTMGGGCEVRHRWLVAKVVGVGGGRGQGR